VFADLADEPPNCGLFRRSQLIDGADVLPRHDQRVAICNREGIGQREGVLGFEPDPARVRATNETAPVPVELYEPPVSRLARCLAARTCVDRTAA
jgi:hypothetical protein